MGEPAVGANATLASLMAQLLQLLPAGAANDPDRIRAAIVQVLPPSPPTAEAFSDTEPALPCLRPGSAVLLDAPFDYVEEADTTYGSIASSSLGTLHAGTRRGRAREPRTGSTLLTPLPPVGPRWRASRSTLWRTRRRDRLLLSAGAPR